MVFQDPLSSLDPIMKVGKQMTEATLLNNRTKRKNAKAELKTNESKTLIKLKLHIDTRYGSVMDYFEIFLGRMTLCRKAAETLGLQFKLIINEQQLI